MTTAIDSAIRLPKWHLRLARATVTTVAGQAPTLVYIAVYTLAGYIALQSADRIEPLEFARLAEIFLSSSVPILFFAIVIARFLHVGFHQRAKHPIIALPVDVFRFLTSPPRLLLGLPLVLSLCLFVRTFADIKFSIPALVPYSWDPTFMKLDQWLHFGYHPYELLQPVLGHPLITLMLDVVYKIWFMVMWMFWVVLAFALRPSIIRTQFFAAFVLVWSLGGSLAAVGLASVGPCFYGPLGLAPNPYAPLMDYLHQVNTSYQLFAVQAQHLLWQGYTGQQNIVVGISAMPSLHNATSLLFALTAWRMDRRLGIGMYAFAAVMFVGSIHLGWHYAVDAYLGWAIAGLAWWASGRYARAWSKTIWNRNLDEMCARLAKSSD